MTARRLIKFIGDFREVVEALEIQLLEFMQENLELWCDQPKLKPELLECTLATVTENYLKLCGDDFYKDAVRMVCLDKLAEQAVKKYLSEFRER